MGARYSTRTGRRGWHAPGVARSQSGSHSQHALPHPPPPPHPLVASRRRRPRADGGRPGGPVWPPVRPRPAHATACPTPRTTSPPAAAARVAAPHATTRWCATRAPRDDALRGRAPRPPLAGAAAHSRLPPPPTNPTLCLSHPGVHPACLRDRGLYSRPLGLPFPPPTPAGPSGRALSLPLVPVPRCSRPTLLPGRPPAHPLSRQCVFAVRCFCGRGPRRAHGRRAAGAGRGGARPLPLPLPLPPPPPRLTSTTTATATAFTGLDRGLLDGRSVVGGVVVW